MRDMEVEMNWMKLWQVNKIERWAVARKLAVERDRSTDILTIGIPAKCQHPYADNKTHKIVVREGNRGPFTTAAPNSSEQDILILGSLLKEMREILGDVLPQGWTAHEDGDFTCAQFRVTSALVPILPALTKWLRERPPTLSERLKAEGLVIRGQTITCAENPNKIYLVKDAGAWTIFPTSDLNKARRSIEIFDKCVVAQVERPLPPQPWCYTQGHKGQTTFGNGAWFISTFDASNEEHVKKLIALGDFLES